MNKFYVELFHHLKSMWQPFYNFFHSKDQQTCWYAVHIMHVCNLPAFIVGDTHFTWKSVKTIVWMSHKSYELCDLWILKTEFELWFLLYQWKSLAKKRESFVISIVHFSPFCTAFGCFMFLGNKCKCKCKCKFILNIFKWCFFILHFI